MNHAKPLLALLTVLLVAPFLVAGQLNDSYSSYSFDDSDVSGTTVTDDAGNIDGTINGNVNSVTGIIGESRDFDFTNDYVGLPNSELEFDFLHQTHTGTIRAWFNGDSWTNTDRPTIIGNNNIGGSRRGFIAQVASGEINIGLSDGQGNFAVNWLGPANIGSVNTGQWYHLVFTMNGTHAKAYLDGTLVKEEALASPATPGLDGSAGSDDGDYRIGNSGVEGRNDYDFDGSIDMVGVYEDTWSSAEVQSDYNEGNGCDPYEDPNACASQVNFTLQAVDAFDQSTIQNFSANLTGETTGETYNLNTSTGTITTPVLTNSSELWSLNVSKTGYNTAIYNDINVTTNTGLVALLTRPFKLYNVTYDQNETLGGTNYVRNLSYTLSYQCSNPATTLVTTRADTNLTRTENITCDNTDRTTTKTYQPNTEGLFTINHTISDTSNPLENQTLNNTNFTADLFNPTVQLGLSSPTGWNEPKTDVNATCTDNVTPTLNFTTTWNNATVHNQTSYTNATTLTSSENHRHGTNRWSATCRDLFGETTNSETEELVFKEIKLIDELDNSAFDENNLTSTRIYTDDNSTFYDFKSNNKNNVTWTNHNTSKLRVRLEYPAGDVVTRYIDADLTDTDPIRVCANTDDVQHFEQYVISNQQQRVLIESVFADCYVAMDTTRFAYEDALSLRFFTTENNYGLSIIEDKSESLLASLDGGTQSIINLDNLEFNNKAYSFNLYGDALTFNDNEEANEVYIRWEAIQEDATDLSVEIQRLNTSETVYTKSDFTNPNAFNLTFNYATLQNVSSEELFKITVVKTTENGQSQINRYFNTRAQTGIIDAQFAAIIGIIFVFFGLTVGLAPETFSFLGILVNIVGIGILSFSVGTWYVNFLIGVLVVTMAYIIIVMFNTNQGSITT